MSSTPEEPQRRLSRDEVDARFAELSRQLDDIPFVDVSRPLGPRDYVVDDEDDGAFVPPDPEPVEIGARARLGWFLLVVGVVGAITGVALSLPRWVGMISGLLAAAGVVTLVFSLPRFSDDDDGAVV